jgi:ferric-dicitrate binding protein FerR (iron transport regulator)
MTDPACRRWADEPEVERDHLATCASCRLEAARLEALDRNLASVAAEPPARQARELPVAPWEGAQHRAWGFVVLALLAVAALAGALFFTLGISPFAAIADLARSAAGSRRALALLTGSLGTLLPAAPRRFDVGIAIGFVVVNGLLFYMLRRGPRGYDVRSR